MFYTVIGFSAVAALIASGGTVMPLIEAGVALGGEFLAKIMVGA